MISVLRYAFNLAMKAATGSDRHHSDGRHRRAVRDAAECVPFPAVTGPHVMTPRPSDPLHSAHRRPGCGHAGRLALRLYLQWVVVSFLILGGLSFAAVAF